MKKLLTSHALSETVVHASDPFPQRKRLGFQAQENNGGPLLFHKVVLSNAASSCFHKAEMQSRTSPTPVGDYVYQRPNKDFRSLLLVATTIFALRS